MSRLTPQAQATAMLANIDALRHRLKLATEQVEEAWIAMSDGLQNQAIGGICDLEAALPECDALLRATLVLHRMRALNLQEGGAP